jgi:hypothetical protein
MSTDAPPPGGFWRIDLVYENGRRYRARHYEAEHAPSALSSPTFHTPGAVQAWLMERGCHKSEQDPDVWYD